MIPGPQRIFAVVPKVRMAAKMQKLSLNYYFVHEGDFLGSLSMIAHHARPEAHGRWPDCEKLINLFTIFLGTDKFPYEEVRQGIENAGDYIRDLRSKKQYPNTSNAGQLVSDRYEQFKQNVIYKKLREIFNRRQIPMFGHNTKGRLNYERVPGIIDESNLDSFLRNSVRHEITVFKFRDKNGRLSLNFHANYEPSYSTDRHRRRY